MDRQKGLYTKNLRKVYGKREIVKGIEINVQPGEIVGLLGPNGAGKTTSFYMLVGLIKATEGQVILENENVTKLPIHKRARKGLGYLPQETSVFRKLTVEENIRAIIETLPIKKEAQKALIEAHLEELHLKHLAKQKAYTLSGGERRRLEITRALVKSPKYLLMDEPFSGVDPINVQEVKEIVLKLKTKNIGILITDHNVRETLSIVDRAYLMYDGSILSSGTSKELLKDPHSRELYLGNNFTL